MGDKSSTQFNGREVGKDAVEQTAVAAREMRSAKHFKIFCGGDFGLRLRLR